MLVLCCGSRKVGNPKDAQALIALRLGQLPSGAVIMHGGAIGVDMWVDGIAYSLGFQVKVFPADWEQHGRSAGILRNNNMLDMKPDLVLAFWNGVSKGTVHTIQEARKRGIEVEVLPVEPPEYPPDEQLPITGRFFGANPEDTEREAGTAKEIETRGPIKYGLAEHMALWAFRSGEVMTAYEASKGMTDDWHAIRREAKRLVDRGFLIKVGKVPNRAPRGRTVTALQITETGQTDLIRLGPFIENGKP